MFALAHSSMWRCLDLTLEPYNLSSRVLQNRYFTKVIGMSDWFPNFSQQKDPRNLVHEMVLLLASPTDNDSKDETQGASKPSSKVHDPFLHPSNSTTGYHGGCMHYSHHDRRTGLQMLFNSLRQRQETNPNLLISKYQLTFSHWLYKAQWKRGLYDSFDLGRQPN